MEFHYALRIGQSFTAMQTGKLGFGGETASVLLANLKDLRALEDRSIPEMRLASGTIAADSA